MGNSIASCGGSAVMIGSMWIETRQVIFDLRWMLVFIVVLILADLWFGLSEALKRHETLRFSRAGRRTCNKAVDYISYLLIGTLIGMAIFEPLGITNHTVTAAVGLGLGMLWEIDSIVGHICVLHGINNRFSVKKFLIAIIKKKDEDIGEALEESIEEKK